MMRNLEHYPGGDLVARGLADLSAGVISEEALLVLVAHPRLQDLGFEIEIPAFLESPYKHRLYEAIENRNPKGAYADYTALIRKVTSFTNAYDQFPNS